MRVDSDREHPAAGADGALRHRELVAACAELASASQREDPAAFVRLWHRIDHELRDHMAMEEEHVFPRFEDDHPGDVEALRDDHTRLRGLLDEISQHVARHGIHAGRLDRLAAELDAHTAREDQTVYRWAAVWR